MWGTIFKVALFVGSAIYQHFNQAGNEKIEPTKDTSNFPEFEEGIGVNVVFGYAYIKNPQVVWYKLEDLSEITQEVSYTKIIRDSWDDLHPGIVPATMDIPTGEYAYSCNFQEKLCLSNIDSLEFIFIDGNANRCNWNSDTTTPLYYGWSTNESDIFIGNSYTSIGTDKYDYDSPNTGIGLIDIEFGGDAQTPNTFLKTSEEQGTTISANRGVVGVIKKKIYIGKGIVTPSVVPWQYLVKRTDVQHDGTAQWLPLKAHTGYGLNVIHAIRELIISERIGAGHSDTLIDSTTFEAAANRCYLDGIGVSFHTNNTSLTARELIDELLHTYAIGDMYFDMDSATFKIKLYRDDYTYATLPEVVSDETIVVKNLTKEDANEVTNSVNVMYTDRFNFELKAAPYQDDSSIARIGINPQTINMPKLFNPVYALKIATQAVLFSTSQLHLCQLECPLEFDEYNKGDVFNLTDDRNGLDKVTFRVLSKTRTERSGERITLNVLEDIYGIGKGSIGTGENNPEYPTLENVANPIIKEMPFFINRANDPDPDTNIGETTGNLIALCSQPSNYTSFGLWAKLNSGTDYIQDSSGNSFSNINSLSSDIGLTDTILPVTNTSVFVSGSYILVDNEIMLVYKSLSNNVYVYRGMQDTLPSEHLSDAIVYELYYNSQSIISSIDNLVVDSDYNIKLTSESKTGSQNVADATAINITPENRSIRPYNAGKFQVNAYGYENDGIIWIGVDNTSLISWANRNRLLQWQIDSINQNTESITSESGVLYKIEVWDETDTTLKRTQDLIDAEEFDYTTALETTDFGALGDKIIKLSSKRPKDSSPFVFTNTDVTSSITASTKTIVFKGQDLTGLVKVGYTITLANTSLNNGALTVNSITESGGDSTIIVDETCYNETLSGLDETLSVPDYWESYQEWSMLVRRLTAPNGEFGINSAGNYACLFSSTDYNTYYYYYEYTESISPAEPTEPSDPKISSSIGSSVSLDTYPSTKRFWVKAVSLYHGQPSAIGEFKNY